MRTILILGILFSTLSSHSAVRYLRSTDGNDADAGTTWALAKATLPAALAVCAAGDTLYVSQVHQETTNGVLTITSPGTSASPVNILCGNDAAEPPTALATTAQIRTSGTSTINLNGFAYCYGVNFHCSTNSSSAAHFIIGSFGGSQVFWRFEVCTLFLKTTSSGAQFRLGTTASGMNGHDAEFQNCILGFSNVAQTIVPLGRFTWKNSALPIAGLVPTSLFKTVVGGLNDIYAENLDLSLLGSGKSIIDVSATTEANATFVNCKLGASVDYTTGLFPGLSTPNILFVNCDSIDSNYAYRRISYRGTNFSETVIVRTGGASDGVTPISYRMSTTVNNKFAFPLKSEPIQFWNTTVGSSVTVTIPVITDNVTLTDADAWIEVDYLGTSGFPLGVAISDRAADILATPVNQPTDGTSTWTTTGLGTPVKQELGVTFTPQEIGIIKATVHLARASTTMYYDPKILVSSSRQYLTVGGNVNEGVSSGGGSSVVILPVGRR